MESKDNTAEEIEIKLKTTSQILKDLDNCVGVTKRTKEVIKMYTDYIKLYKKNKIKIGNLNMILYCNNTNYFNVIKVINKLLYKEGIIKNAQYQFIADIHITTKVALEEKGLYIINDESLKEYKITKFLRDYPHSVFIIICNENNSKIVNNVKDKFTWELEITEATEKEKTQYIKQVIKEHGLECKVTSTELRTMTDYELPEIESFLIGGILRANKKCIKYISNEELNIIDNDTTKEGIKRLNSLVGLENVKEQVQQILNYLKVHKKRGNMPTLNMCFEGNPGTGKTEVARIIAEIFSDTGILEGNFVEVGRNDLVAGYVGQTAIKTQKVIDLAIGGVLFIDEAYSLFSNDNYSNECISTLIKAMEDHREDLCVILAGYPQQMEELLKANCGFESRIAFKINFQDYSEDELYNIFINLVKQEKFILDKSCKSAIIEYFKKEIDKKTDNFSNGRLARNLFEKVKFEQATRIINEKSKDLDMIKIEDINNVVNKIKTKEIKNKIGFAI